MVGYVVEKNSMLFQDKNTKDLNYGCMIFFQLHKKIYTHACFLLLVVQILAVSVQ